MKRKLRITGSLLICALALCVIAAAVLIYMDKVHELVDEEKADNAYNVECQYVKVLKSELTRYLNDAVESGMDIGRFFSDLTSREALNYLSRKTMRLDVDLYVVADRKGNTRSHRGEKMDNISGKDYFQNALCGKASISNMEMNDSGKPYVVCCAPIIHGDSVAGVVLLVLGERELNELVTFDGRDDGGYSCLVRSDGMFIAHGGKQKPMSSFKGVADAFSGHPELMMEDLVNERGGVMEYGARQHDKRIVSYVPVGINGWSLMTSRAQNGTDTRAFKLFVSGMTLAAVLLVACGVMVADFLIALHRTNKSLRISNERYNIVLNLTHEVVFEWDIKAGVLSSAQSQFTIFSDFMRHGGFPNSARYTNIVYRNDVDSFIDSFNRVAKDGGSTVAEYRIMDRFGEYVWFRNSMTAITDEKGVPLKVVGILTNVEDERFRMQRLKDAAASDPLTKLYNKIAMRDMADEYLSVPDRYAALLMIDADNFKMVNDTFGHLSGDTLICEFADTLKKIFRTSDIIGRFGGDEFCVFMKGVDIMETVTERTELVLEAFSRTFDTNGSKLELSASVGVAFCPQHGRSFRELVENADKALYYLKKHGKNGCFIYDPAVMS